MKINESISKDDIVNLSFFNFSNAVTAAYFANRKLEVLKVNYNFNSWNYHSAI